MNQNTYQPFLDYEIVPNPAVIFPTIVENYDWKVFRAISKEYYRSLSIFLREESAQGEKGQNPCIQLQLPLLLSSLGSDKKAPRGSNTRNAGRKPEDFFSLFKSFICARYMDIDVNSPTICSLLNSNPAFWKE